MTTNNQGWHSSIKIAVLHWMATKCQGFYIHYVYNKKNNDSTKWYGP